MSDVIADATNEPVDSIGIDSSTRYKADNSGGENDEASHACDSM